MVCIFCGEADPFKLTMSTRMMHGKALSVDVCFSCRWREQEQAEVIRMQDEGMLWEREREGLCKDRDFLELLRKLDRAG